MKPVVWWQSLCFMPEGLQDEDPISQEIRHVRGCRSETSYSLMWYGILERDALPRCYPRHLSIIQIYNITHEIVLNSRTSASRPKDRKFDTSFHGKSTLYTGLVLVQVLHSKHFRITC
ncbi:hypothetical protein AVEN_150270-1 [Araneus ventricosus]|uniref:Uncharacterized protein n=1 Tax=Araneus ventricosus TaxID=182803 RepID=A0A4Y2HCW5_ARAVE|nr:hypothetical protein AVEN_150270-1 [Araneus ventricosus]